MTNAQLRTYLEDNLAAELAWVLRAAVEWHIQDRAKLELDGYHMQVYTMDSCFVRSRALFEFFTKRLTTDNYYTCADQFGTITPLVSTLYTSDRRSGHVGWDNPLHSHLMHAQSRISSNQLQGFDPSEQKDLKEMPLDFAREIVRLWREFSKAMHASSDTFIKSLSPIADSILVDAINGADKVRTNTFNIEVVQRLKIAAIAW